MIIAILVVLLLLEIFNHIRWKVLTMALSYYIVVKLGCSEPSDEELKECLNAVIEKGMKNE